MTIVTVLCLSLTSLLTKPLLLADKETPCVRSWPSVAFPLLIIAAVCGSRPFVLISGGSLQPFSFTHS